jgi:hypothetical protein
MKHSLIAVINCKTKAAVPFLNRFQWNTTTQFCAIILAAAFLFASCGKQDTSQPKMQTQAESNLGANADDDLMNQQSKTLMQLKQAREATARYKNIDTAFADGYIDIHVVMENMGYHFERPGNVDSVFDITHPELLVYNKKEDGSFKLVAVEYAVPLDKSVNAPKGFAGKQDVWDHNDGFGLWLLHAWVWDFNPDGVFNPTNPRVHVQM